MGDASATWSREREREHLEHDCGAAVTLRCAEWACEAVSFGLTGVARAAEVGWAEVERDGTCRVTECDDVTGRKCGSARRETKAANGWAAAADGADRRVSNGARFCADESGCEDEIHVERRGPSRSGERSQSSASTKGLWRAVRAQGRRKVDGMLSLRAMVRYR